MGALAEYLRSEAESIRREKARRQAALQEWLDLLNSLFRDIDGWLDRCDPEGLLDRTAHSVVITDPALGEYRAPARKIEIGNRTVDILPIARYVAGSIRPPGAEKPIRPHGLVEMRESGMIRYYLYQVPGPKWYIQPDVRSMRASDDAVDPLDAERFEAALTSLLR